MAPPQPAPSEPGAPRALPLSPGLADTPSFEAVYDEHAAFVWRTVRRLGVEEAAAEDVLQEIFLVVHRRLEEFEARSSFRTWLFGITLLMVRNHKRSQRRKRIDPSEQAAEALERLPADASERPDRRAERARAVERLYALLERLSDDQREIFVMAELEQMRGTEIAEATGLNLNTVYARLKAARREFNQAVARERARSDWRAP